MNSLPPDQASVSGNDEQALDAGMSGNAGIADGMEVRVIVRDRLPTVFSVCAHRFFFYSFTASDDSVGAIAGLLALSWCTMALEVRRQG